MSRPCGFLLRGGLDNPRRLIDYRRALDAYCAVDPSARVEIPAFLSAYCYGVEFKRLLESTGSVRGYGGPVVVVALRWDVDRADPDEALRDARRLASNVADRYGLDAKDLVVSFSGSKGYHIELPLTGTPASPVMHLAARRLCEARAAEVNIGIDTGVYDRVRPFRAPNSRHYKTGLHKVPIDLDDLLYMDVQDVHRRAAEPVPFDWPVAPSALPARLRADWDEAVGSVAEAERRRREVVRHSAAEGYPKLNARTREFIAGRLTFEPGDRHRLLFSSAANLAEFSCPPALAHALLTGPGRDLGLPPTDVARQIDCGLRHVANRIGEIAS